MLFIHINTLSLALHEGERRRLLDLLSARELKPLTRSLRRRYFQLLMGANADAAFPEMAATELERERIAQAESKGNIPAAPGELFCTDDCIFSLVFGSNAEEGVSVGIVYSVNTTEPLAKFDRFCRDVREALSNIRDGVGAPAKEEEPPPELPLWKPRGRRLSQGLARFIAIQPAEFVRAGAAFRGGRELMRASELMEVSAARLFLRRVQEMRREGYTARRLFTEADAMGGVSVERMLDAGLLERELRVSCRKSGHALFDLPSPDSLAAITISKAKCSQCAAPVADEVIEETINPTRLAVSLLEDGSWLNHRLYKIILSLGVPESEIATGPASAHGESSLAVDVCGTSFLFVTKDGDLTPAFSRRIGEIVEETEATHLVVVLTGKVEDEGRLRLYEFAWRRARDGQDLDITLVEGLANAQAEIERSFERAVQRELSHHLYALNAALGLNASNFVIERFRLMNVSGAANNVTQLLPPLPSHTVT